MWSERFSNTSSNNEVVKLLLQLEKIDINLQIIMDGQH